ncbi:MAG: hypothetical protein JKY56_04130 [Kofleriaceae bacterium]|nr:hypothetical protein [Kofleriaceae bacterium]
MTRLISPTCDELPELLEHLLLTLIGIEAEQPQKTGQALDCYHKTPRSFATATIGERGKPGGENGHLVRTLGFLASHPQALRGLST